jgi:RHH-type transcriptional regulator, rel operon repressor / antitoxin RelB
MGSVSGLTAWATCPPLLWTCAKMCYLEYMRTRKGPSAGQTMTLRLDRDTLRRLDELAQATDHSKAWLAAKAVKTYLNLNEWQIAAIHEAVVKADRRGAKFFTQEQLAGPLTDRLGSTEGLFTASPCDAMRWFPPPRVLWEDALGRKHKIKRSALRLGIPKHSISRPRPPWPVCRGSQRSG